MERLARQGGTASRPDRAPSIGYRDQRTSLPRCKAISSHIYLFNYFENSLGLRFGSFLSRTSEGSACNHFLLQIAIVYLRITGEEHSPRPSAGQHFVWFHNLAAIQQTESDVSQASLLFSIRRIKSTKKIEPPCHQRLVALLKVGRPTCRLYQQLPVKIPLVMNFLGGGSIGKACDCHQQTSEKHSQHGLLQGLDRSTIETAVRARKTSRPGRCSQLGYKTRPRASKPL